MKGEEIRNDPNDKETYIDNPPVMPVPDYLEDLATSTIYRFASGSASDGYVNADIAKDTIDNSNFRKVLYTTDQLQLVLMSLKPGEDIGKEIHSQDQFFRVEQGTGVVLINGKETAIRDDSAIIVPGGSEHNLTNIGNTELKVYTLYAPPHHADGVIHKTKEDAVKDKSDVYIKKEAKKGETYEYSTTQVNAPSDLADEVIRWGKDNIDKDDIVSPGLENDIHATIMYGLHGDNPESVERLIHDKFRKVGVELGLVTSFSTPEYDVLKISVFSPTLDAMHYLIERSLPNSNTFPTYQPHITIAYLKKGTARKYIGSDFFRGKYFTTQDVTFINNKGVRHTIPLR